MPWGSYCRKMTVTEISRKRNRNIVMEVKEFLFNEISATVLKDVVETKDKRIEAKCHTF